MFWGAWGAVLPAVQVHAGVDDATLGIALLCVGAGAIVAMRLAGELVDRWGAPVLPAILAVFAASATLPALATSGVALGATLLVAGAASGALDVAINAEAVGAERAGRRPLLNLAHATFSLAVVAASLLTGALRAAGAGPLVVMASAAALLGVATIATAVLEAAPAERTTHSRPPLRHVSRVLAVLGFLTGLAFAVESAWQNWSAVLVEGPLGARPGIAALAPAVFALGAAGGRLAGNRVVRRAQDRTTIAVAAAVAAVGAVLAAVAGTAVVAFVGVALAGLGTSVCAPLLISRAGRSVPPDQRGGAVSIVTTIAYVGFLVAPAAVGLLAQASSLRWALGAMALVAVALMALAWRLPPALSTRSSG